VKKNKLLIILPLTFVTIASVTNVFLSSCSPEETESQKMLNLYKDKSNLKTTSIDNSADYFTLWKDSVQKKDT
jgi:hypothetical protein